MPALALAAHRWFHPRQQEFAARAHCMEIAGHDGSVVLFAALFIRLTFPVFLITLRLAHYAHRILRSGQVPPPGAWVCRDTLPLTGQLVRIRAYAGLATPLTGLALLCRAVVTFLDLRAT